MKNKHKSCNNNKKIELLIDFNISRQKKTKKRNNNVIIISNCIGFSMRKIALGD